MHRRAGRLVGVLLSVVRALALAVIPGLRFLAPADVWIAVAASVAMLSSGVLRLDSGLCFATAQALEDRVRELPESDGATPLHGVILHVEGVNFGDSQSAEQLAAIRELVASHEATLRLARVKPSVLRADDFVDRLGGRRIHGKVQRAVEGQLQA